MNTKIITFGVFATLFMGAYFVLCHAELSSSVALGLSIAFAAASLLCAVLDYCGEYHKISCIRKTVTDIEGKIKEIKKDVESKKKPEEVKPEDIQKHNGELQDLLKKLTNFGDALNQVKTELNQLAQQQQQNY